MAEEGLELDSSQAEKREIIFLLLRPMATILGDFDKGPSSTRKPNGGVNAV